ncbi:hypothetical protein BC832DRAFT_528372 [Gaertneriomyces semiglobifer]|nr:hypothetical protein BC832DRAFT_528372 [Gaertneriomyces semiglobifer]
MPSPPAVRRNIKTLSSAFASCSTQASVYGKCISKHFGAVQKNDCNKEFQEFKKCFTKFVSITL